MKSNASAEEFGPQIVVLKVAQFRVAPRLPDQLRSIATGWMIDRIAPGKLFDDGLMLGYHRLDISGLSGS